MGGVEPKDRQQEETEGKVQFHSRLWNAPPIFESSQPEDSYVGDLPYHLAHVADEETASEKSPALDNRVKEVLEPGFETRSELCF